MSKTFYDEATSQRDRANILFVFKYAVREKTQAVSSACFEFSKRTISPEGKRFTLRTLVA